MALPPGVALSLTVMAINFLGDALRDSLDPRLRRAQS
jgi:peptide/nickel transport system permease protein